VPETTSLDYYLGHLLESTVHLESLKCLNYLEVTPMTGIQEYAYADSWYMSLQDMSRFGIQAELGMSWSKLLEPIPAVEPGLISRLWLRTPC